MSGAGGRHAKEEMKSSTPIGSRGRKGDWWEASVVFSVAVISAICGLVRGWGVTVELGRAA